VRAIIAQEWAGRIAEQEMKSAEREHRLDPRKGDDERTSPGIVGA